MTYAVDPTKTTPVPFAENCPVQPQWHLYTGYLKSSRGSKGCGFANGMYAFALRNTLSLINREPFWNIIFPHKQKSNALFAIGV